MNARFIPAHCVGLWLLLTVVALATESPALRLDPAAEPRAPAAVGDPLARSVLLSLDKSAVIDLPVPARDVVVSNPAIADAVIRTPTRIFLHGRRTGQTTVFLFGRGGTRLATLDIRVEPDLRDLEATLARLLPQAQIQAAALNDHVILTGEAMTAADAAFARDLAARFAGTPDKVISRLTTGSPAQVLLRVQVLELRHGALAQANLPATPQDQATVAATVSALEAEGLVRVLAEPDLTALSGAPVRFLAGAEVPVPGAQGVIYRPVGVALAFTPTLKADGRITVEASAEVSEISYAGALPTEDHGPALVVRRAETTVDLAPGHSLVLGGLAAEPGRRALDGTLSRADPWRRPDKEVVVIVTPSLATVDTAPALVPLVAERQADAARAARPGEPFTTER